MKLRWIEPEIKKKCQCYEHQLRHKLNQLCVSKQQSVLPEDGELKRPTKRAGLLMKCSDTGKMHETG
jgi:hypothetical protein